MERKLKNETGITLVALVVTIVVLLILAGITITYMLGDNGIIKLAQDARNKTEEAFEKEQEDIQNLVDLLGKTENNEPEVIHVTITIECVNEDGEKIGDKTVSVKKGESYKVQPPTIEAYVPLELNKSIIPNQDETIQIIYGVDNWGGGTELSSPDGIADKYQARLYFSSSNEGYGTVSKRGIVLTKRDSNGLPAENGTFDFSETVEASTTDFSRTYFSSWTCDGTVLSTATSFTGEELVDLKGNSTYQIIANFGRSGTGGIGGGTGS